MPAVAQQTPCKGDQQENEWYLESLTGHHVLMMAMLQSV